MHCLPSLVMTLSALLLILGLLHLLVFCHRPSCYGKHEPRQPNPGENHAAEIPRRAHLPARRAWFLQELPAFLVPALLLALRNPSGFAPLGCRLLGGMFCGHYFHR